MTTPRLTPSRTLTAGLAACLALTGCFRTSARTLDPDEPHHKTKDWDATDLKGAVAKIATTLIESKKFNAAGGGTPVIVVYGVQNDTAEHLNTQLIADKIQTALNETGAVRFVDRDMRKNIDEEIQFQQGGKVDPATAARVGRQLGATHVMWGRLASIDTKEGKGIRLSKKSLRYYNLTVRVTDLASSEVIYSNEFEVAREESQPLIGW